MNRLLSRPRRLLRFVRPHAPALVVAYLCMAILNLTTVLYAALLGPALDFVFNGDVKTVVRGRGPNQKLRPIWDMLPADVVATVEELDADAALWLIPGLIVVIAAVKGFAQAGQFFLFGRAAQGVLLAVRRDAFDAMLRQSPTFFTVRYPHGDLLSRLTHDANDVERAFFYGYGSLLRDTLAIVGLLAYLFYADFTLALLTFITVPLALLPLLRFTSWMKRVSKRGQAAQADITAVAHEALAGVSVVQAFGNEAYESARIERAGQRYYRQMLRSYFIRAARTPTMEILGTVGVAALFMLLGRDIHRSGGDPAHYLSFLGAIFLLYDPLKKLGKVSDYLATGAAAAERLFEIIDLEPEIRDAPDARELRLTGPKSDESDARIQFDSVSFEYLQDCDAPVLHEVSLDIPAGSCLALVGPSGSGKTTVANLLSRFFDLAPGCGRISIGGIDIRAVTLASLRRQISIVSQETFLFNASVATNIGYGRPGALPEEIRTVARAANADAFIQSLPNGYETVIGERGLTLSGGQRQRLAIARALLRDAPILILDEATSHLDVDSERVIQQALEALLRDRTSLVIAHRLSTVRRADQICVLKDGRILERGCHESLLAAGGEYARLHELQFTDPQQRHRPESPVKAQPQP